MHYTPQEDDSEEWWLLVGWLLAGLSDTLIFHGDQFADVGISLAQNISSENLYGYIKGEAVSKSDPMEIICHIADLYH